MRACFHILKGVNPETEHPGILAQTRLKEVDFAPKFQDVPFRLALNCSQTDWLELI